MNQQFQIKKYGNWESPITPEIVAEGATKLREVAIDDNIYWIEGRPEEHGRNVIVKYLPGGKTVAITPPGFNVRTRTHEYGGGDYIVKNGHIYFSNYSDQCLYHQYGDNLPEPLTTNTEMRYSDIIIDDFRKCLIAVREEHVTKDEVINTLVSIPFEGGNNGKVLLQGNDFYSSPRLSPDGKYLVWLTWNYPNMPWDGCELWIGGLNTDGLLIDSYRIAGGTDESIFQPAWSPDNILYFISDQSGWWNLYRVNNLNETEHVYQKDAEFGMPQWVFGLSMYAFISADYIICAYVERGISYLARLNIPSKTLEPIENDYTDISYVQCDGKQAVFCAGAPNIPTSVVSLDLETAKFSEIRRSSDIKFDSRYFSFPQAIEFPTENKKSAHAFLYQPSNPDFKAPAEELPPVIVLCHGGPTGAASTTLRLNIQFWTSRGFAVLDVNYGGSTGYGREYRERLNHNWGVVDVNDCINGALYLVRQRKADPRRLLISGSSAGGYTVLCALTFHNIFKAGASHYGIGDLVASELETHKFESHYSHHLIGPYPERIDLYQGRSPINFASQINSPIIFFHGVEDQVVLPHQTESMVSAIRKNSIPVAYLLLEGEQHGFRQADNIKKVLENELYFYSRVLLLNVPEPAESVKIENEMNLNQ